MAETSALADRVDARLRAVARRIAALPEYASRNDLDRVALEAEWRDTLDRLDWLDQRARQGDLSADQLGAHRRVLSLLTAHAGLVAQLGLAAPGANLNVSDARRPDETALAEAP